MHGSLTSDAVVDASGFYRFPLIGLCQGGVVAVAYAAQHPERVSRLVLYDGYLHGAYVAGAKTELTKQAQVLSQMIEVGWGKSAGAFREIFANLLMPDAGKDQLRWMGELQRRSASATGAHELWGAFHTFDVRTYAKKIEVRTLIFTFVATQWFPSKQAVIRQR